jgi:23S rRNA-/tRNA-specific pseudouridylate synthase
LALQIIDPEAFPTRSKALRVIRKKKILLVKPSACGSESKAVTGKVDSRVQPGLIIRLKQTQEGTNDYPSLSYTKPAGLAVPEVVYEVDDFAIINKPSGMVCHSIQKGGYDSNSVLRMAPLILRYPGEHGLKRPALIHRLDAGTSGLLILAKTKLASRILSKAFDEREVSKTYIAILQGLPSQPEGRLQSLIADKISITKYKVLRSTSTTRGYNLSWVEFRPETGRKHQLRIHASKLLDCPIVGDELYGSTCGRGRFFLCATDINFQFQDQSVHVQIDAPPRFHRYWEREAERYTRFVNWTRKHENP